jgi:hypothetical protein
MKRKKKIRRDEKGKEKDHEEEKGNKKSDTLVNQLLQRNARSSAQNNCCEQQS